MVAARMCDEVTRTGHLLADMLAGAEGDARAGHAGMQPVLLQLAIAGAQVQVVALVIDGHCRDHRAAAPVGQRREQLEGCARALSSHGRLPRMLEPPGCSACPHAPPPGLVSSAGGRWLTAQCCALQCPEAPQSVPLAPGIAYAFTVLIHCLLYQAMVTRSVESSTRDQQGEHLIESLLERCRHRLLCSCLWSSHKINLASIRPSHCSALWLGSMTCGTKCFHSAAGIWK